MPRSHDEMSRIDPNAVPASMDQKVVVHLKHPEGKNGIIKYDKISLTLNVALPGETPSVTNDAPIQTFQGKWTGDPERVEIIDDKFLNRDQPFVGTCSRPVKDRNMGCISHNGCPYPDPTDPRGRGPGPFNVIIEKDGQSSPCPCYRAYHGVRLGRPTSQVHYLYSGWRIDTEATSTVSTKAVMMTDEWGGKAYQDKEVVCPVDRLGPMYAHHFGKRKQKIKPLPETREEMDEIGIPSNTAPGTLTGAPRVQNPGQVKLGG